MVEAFLARAAGQETPRVEGAEATGKVAAEAEDSAEETVAAE